MAAMPSVETALRAIDAVGSETLYGALVLVRIWTKGGGARR